MNNKQRLVVSVLGIVGCVLLLAACVPAPAAPTSTEEKIAGTWIAECKADVQKKQFPVLFTFTTDGSLLGSTGTPAQSTAHGTWVRGRSGEIGFTFVVLMSDPKSPDPTGQYAGRFTCVGTLQRDAGSDTWSGPFKTTVFDANGQVFFNETGTFKLTRIAVEPLN